MSLRPSSRANWSSTDRRGQPGHRHLLETCCFSAGRRGCCPRDGCRPRASGAAQLAAGRSKPARPSAAADCRAVQSARVTQDGRSGARNGLRCPSPARSRRVPLAGCHRGERQRITSIDFSGSTAAKRSAPPPHASGPGRNGAPRPRAVRIDDAPVVAAPAPPSPASTIDAGEVPNARSVGPDSEGFFLGQKPRQRSASRSA